MHMVGAGRGCIVSRGQKARGQNGDKKAGALPLELAAVFGGAVSGGRLRVGLAGVAAVVAMQLPTHRSGFVTDAHLVMHWPHGAFVPISAVKAAFTLAAYTTPITSAITHGPADIRDAARRMSEGRHSGKSQELPLLLYESDGIDNR